jgi:hypothetical protein
MGWDGRKQSADDVVRTNGTHNKIESRDSHVKVLDGLLSAIHHFAREGEPRVAVRVVNVHGCVHGGAPTIQVVAGAVKEEGEAEAAAVAEEEESNQGQTGEGECEGGKRDDDGRCSPAVGGTELPAGAPERLRFRDESGSEKTRSARRSTAS